MDLQQQRQALADGITQQHHDRGLTHEDVDRELLGVALMSFFDVLQLLGGSGFLGAYLVGMILGNRSRERLASALPAMDGYAWLAQAGNEDLAVTNPYTGDTIATVAVSFTSRSGFAPREP